MIEGIGELILSVFGNGLCHVIGAGYLWIKNGGKKSYKQLHRETGSLSDVGKTILTSGLVVGGLLLLVGFLAFAVYSLCKYGI
jgi:hypothetical protein